ncbi:MAG TPA: hypothetical protein VF587_07435 [Solirubrobacteraceae bacterium]
MRRLLFPAAGLAGLALAVVPALAADQTVTTDGNRFEPDEVAVQPGNKITIHNGDTGNHDLYWDDGAPGHPGASKGSVGDSTDWSTERTFGDADNDKSFRYYCSIHGGPDGSGMSGIVYVNSAGTVPTDPGGGGGGTTTTGGGGGTTTTSTTPPPGGTSTTPPPGGTTTGTTTTPPPGADSTPPRVSGARARATKRGLRLVLTLSEPADVTVRVLRRGRRVARRTFAVGESGQAVLRIRRKLKRGRYSVRLSLIDAAGNRSSRRLAARVR